MLIIQNIQKLLFSHLRINVCDSLFVGAARVGLSCRLPGCRELKRTSSASAKWQSIFLSSIVVAVPVGESAHSEQQLVWGWFYREWSLYMYMWVKFRMLLKIENEWVFAV